MELNLAQNIRMLRKQAGFTQEQLAEALGVTTGAVHKWESGKATPELPLLVELAAFFETSVDAMLDYQCQKQNMAQTATQIRAYRNSRDFADGMRFAERALQKYPNSFDVAYQSAMLYYMSVLNDQGANANRAMELFQRAITLIDQNTDQSISTMTIHQQIAGCYCYQNNMDKAIEVLQKTNIGGINDGQIGLLMSQNPKLAEESLHYLSDALHNIYAQLYNICIGYANAYGVLKNLDRIEDLVKWLLDLGHGLKMPDTVNFLDKTDVRLYTILAEVRMLQSDEIGAENWLREAYRSALRFDAAPQYQSAYGMKFYHSSQTATSYDDMGETGVAMIENCLNDDTSYISLRPLWSKIRAEEAN